MDTSVTHESVEVPDAPLTLAEPPPRSLGLASTTALLVEPGHQPVAAGGGRLRGAADRPLWDEPAGDRDRRGHRRDPARVGGRAGGTRRRPLDGAAARPARRPGVVRADRGEPGPVRGLGDVRDRGDRRSGLRASSTRRGGRSSSWRECAATVMALRPLGVMRSAGALRGLGRACCGGVPVRPGASPAAAGSGPGGERHIVLDRGRRGHRAAGLVGAAGLRLHAPRP